MDLLGCFLLFFFFCNLCLAIFYFSFQNDRSNGSSQSGPTQRASALAALSSAFNPSAATKTNDRFNGPDHSGPTQRASALAALSSAFNPSPKTTTTDKLNSSSNSGPTQRASALAALSSAFNPSAGTKTTTVRRSGPSQGSQRAAAVAALSTVLTAEQRKGPSDASSLSSESPSEVNLSGRRNMILYSSIFAMILSRKIWIFLSP